MSSLLVPKQRSAEYYGEPDFLIDTEAVNAKYRARSGDPRRTWTGTTLVDQDCKGDLLQKRLYEAGGKFIQAMAKKGWDLIGKVKIKGPFTARDIETNAVLMGKNEWHLEAAFRLQSAPRTIRTELPPGVVRRDPEHRLTTAEAVRAWGGK